MSATVATVIAAAASSSKGKRYTPPKPAPLPEDYEEFYATLSSAEKELDLLAKEKLGTSYFIQWSHMYLKWSKAKADKAKADKAKADKAPSPAPPKNSSS